MILIDEDLAKNFLSKAGLANFRIEKIAGDASFRSYYRIFFGQETKILMFAPPRHEDVKPFIAIDEFLLSHNFSAPKIFSCDYENGFLLLEDFGDNSYRKILLTDISQELDLYNKACDALLELHKIQPPNNIAAYNKFMLLREVMLFVDWYIPLKKKVIDIKQKALFKNLWFQLFDMMDNQNHALVLRDYHADNLMILPERKGFKSVGLLDFQDAVIGSKAYDLVSLLEDARRDVDENNRNKVFDYYLAKSGCDAKSFICDYKILSLQRNVKILGIFARLAIRDKKDSYLNLLPRVIDLVRKRIANDKIFGQIRILLENFL